MDGHNEPGANDPRHASKRGNSTREAAIAYAERGLKVFPLHSVVDGVCTCGMKECGSPGKHPKTPRGVKDATCDRQELESLWKDNSNVGIATGSESGIIVVDIDVPNGEESLDPARI